VLAIRTVRSIIGSLHDDVICLSVCDAMHCGAQGWCRGWTFCCRVPNRALPKFLFSSSNTSVVQDIWFSHKTQWSAQKLTCINIGLPASKADFSLKP